MSTMRFLVFFLFVFHPPGLEAKDLQFRFQQNHCQKNSVPGFNPMFFGECGHMVRQTFSNKKYKNSILKGSLWSFSYIHSLKFKDGDFRFMGLNGSTILESSFENLKADSMDLRNSLVQSVIWKKTSLRNLLAKASRIRKNQFIECDLRQADFWGASLQETSFENSDLRGANLESTHLLFTNFKGARFDNNTKLPFSEEQALQRGMVKVD